MHYQASSRELTIKLVYYGPGLSGKTSNLLGLHERILRASGQVAGEGSSAAFYPPPRMMTLETADDRTLFFDMLPLWFRSTSGETMLRIKVFTVPGQPIHVASRRLVLQGADGVAFIADSQISHTHQNAQSFRELVENIREIGTDFDEIALVIQFNKRDLTHIRSDEELQEMARRGREPVFGAVASTGDGVVETFISLLDLAWTRIDAKFGLGEKLGLTREELLAGAALQVGAEVPVELLLARRFGGASNPLEARP